MNFSCVAKLAQGDFCFSIAMVMTQLIAIAFSLLWLGFFTIIITCSQGFSFLTPDGNLLA